MNKFPVSAVVAALLLVLLIGGCLSSEVKRSQYYDLLPPPANKYADVAVQIGTFDNSTPWRGKFIYRMADGEMLVDDFVRFVQPPDMMLARYLQQYFTLPGVAEAADALFSVSGNVALFELDMTTKEAKMLVVYTITQPDGVVVDRSFRTSAPFAQPLPADFVAAFSRCAADLAEQLQKEVAALK